MSQRFALLLLPALMVLDACGKLGGPAAAKRGRGDAGGDPSTEAFSELGVQLAPPAGMTRRGGDAITEVWTAGQESLQITYQFDLAPATVAQALPAVVHLEQGDTASATSAASALGGGAAPATARRYSAAPPINAVVVAVPRPLQDDSSRGGLLLTAVAPASAESIASRLQPLLASIVFTAMPRNSAVEQALSIGEWSYEGQTPGGEPFKEFIEMCGDGHFTYRSEGLDTGSQGVLPVDASTLVKGRFIAYGGTDAPVIAVHLDGTATYRSFNVTAVHKNAFQTGKRRFLRTGRSCEFAQN